MNPLFSVIYSSSDVAGETSWCNSGCLTYHYHCKAYNLAPSTEPTGLVLSSSGGRPVIGRRMPPPLPMLLPASASESCPHVSELSGVSQTSKEGEKHAGAPCWRNPPPLVAVEGGLFHPLKHSVANCNVHSLSLHRKPLTVCKFFGSLYSHFYSATNMPLMSVILQL